MFCFQLKLLKYKFLNSFLSFLFHEKPVEQYKMSLLNTPSLEQESLYDVKIFNRPLVKSSISLSTDKLRNPLLRTLLERGISEIF
jgi:hypothetical protein